MSRSTKNFMQLKMCDKCVKSYSSWNVFFVDSLLLVTQIIKGKQLYYKMWSSKSKILRIIDIYVLSTVIFITYIKGGTAAQFFFGEGVCNDEGYICYFFTEVIKFYWLMLLVYPGELYRLLGTSSLFNSLIHLRTPSVVIYRFVCRLTYIGTFISMFIFRWKIL